MTGLYRAVRTHVDGSKVTWESDNLFDAVESIKIWMDHREYEQIHLYQGNRVIDSWL